MSLNVIITLVIVMQRLSELRVATRNTAWAKQQGGVEHGREHYWMFFVLHTGWIVAFNVEFYLRGAEVPSYWPLAMAGYVLAQVLRYWSLFSLGRRWNTRIIIIPGEPLVSRGPYRFLPHPNYIAVVLELAAVPIMVGAWFTAAIATVANAVVLLKVRIPAEEQALRSGINDNSPSS